MEIDPHNPNRFDAKNLREDEWFEYKRNKAVQELVQEIKEITETGWLATISKDYLEQLGQMVSMRAGISAILIQIADHAHWAALAICMMSHSSMMYMDGVYKFSKSPFTNEPLYYDNIEWVEDPVKHWLTARLRTLNETKIARASRNRKDDSTNSASREGITERSTSQQLGLFDIH